MKSADNEADGSNSVQCEKDQVINHGPEDAQINTEDYYDEQDSDGGDDNFTKSTKKHKKHKKHKKQKSKEKI